MKKMKFASITWSRELNRWVLRLWIDNSWEFSKSWSVKDQDENETGFVHDSILCEIAHLQDLGYRVTVDL